MARVSNSTIKAPTLISDFKEITKMRLSLSVVFSSIAGYLLGAD
jgi:protoheme IX farnesyltransferase